MKPGLHTQYCQKCLAVNSAYDDACRKCGAKLMIVVVPPSVRHEAENFPTAQEEHLLERISAMENHVKLLRQKLIESYDLIGKLFEISKSQRIMQRALTQTLEEGGVSDETKILARFERLVENELRQSEIISATRADFMEKTLAACAPKSSREFVKVIEQAVEFQLEGKTQEAEKLFEKAFTLEPDNHLIAAVLGNLALNRGNFRLAADYMQKLVAASPNDIVAEDLLGYALLKEGEFAEARSLFENSANAARRSFLRQLLRTVLAIVEQNWTETLAFAKTLLGFQPTAEVHYLVGAAYAQSKRYKIALRHLQKACEIDSNFADAWFLIGWIYTKDGDERSAKEAFSLALRAKDDEAQCRNLLRNAKKYALEESLVPPFAPLKLARKNPFSLFSARLQNLFEAEFKRHLS